MSPRSVAHLKAAAERYQVSPWEVLGRSRAVPVAKARQELMYRMREDGLTYGQIARNLRRDHSTVIHGVRQHAEARRQARVA